MNLADLTATQWINIAIALSVFIVTLFLGRWLIRLVFNRVIRRVTRFTKNTLDDAIMTLLERKIISPEDAYTKSNDKQKFLPFLKKPPADFTEV